MIHSLEIKDLFGVNGYDFDITFHNDLNLLTGRNGSGKTTILKLLWYAISGHFDILVQEIDFSYLKLITDKCSIEIKTQEKPTYLFTINHFDEVNKKYDKSFQNYNLKPIIDEVHNSLFFPTFRRIEGGFTIIPKAGEDEKGNDLYLATNKLSNELSRSYLGVSNHQYITFTSTNDLDRRLKDEIAFVKTEKDNINTERIKTISILNKEGKQDAISQLIENTDKQLEKLESRFDGLNSLVDKHLKKRILLSEKHIIGTGNSKPIPSQRLSAGEKQLFAFLCYVIFSENKTIFIDEPEISLHPDWQRILIPLLLKQSSSNQFIMATHSYLMLAPYAYREIELNINKGF